MIKNLELKLEGKIPVTREELIFLVDSWGRNSTNDFYIAKNGCYPLENLNVSQINDMHEIFRFSLYNGDLSKWNVKNVTNMGSLFSHSKFNGDTNEFKKKIAFLFKFFNEIFVSLKQCGLNYVIARQLQFKRSSIFLKTLFLSKKIDSDINKKLSFLFSKWQFKENIQGTDFFYYNKNFENKYNNGNTLPRTRQEFLEWFETNKVKISNLNISKEEELDMENYLDNFKIDKELTND